MSAVGFCCRKNVVREGNGVSVVKGAFPHKLVTYFLSRFDVLMNSIVLYDTRQLRGSRIYDNQGLKNWSINRHSVFL